MNMPATEFLAVFDDVLSTLDENNIVRREQEEVLFTLFIMRSQVVQICIN